MSNSEIVTPQQAIEQGYTSFQVDKAERLDPLNCLEEAVLEFRAEHGYDPEYFAFKPEPYAYDVDALAENALEQFALDLSEGAYEDAQGDIAETIESYKPALSQLFQQMMDACSKECPTLYQGPRLDLSGIQGGTHA